MNYEKEEEREEGRRIQHQGMLEGREWKGKRGEGRGEGGRKEDTASGDVGEKERRGWNG